jgi:hypothetical protein
VRNKAVRLDDHAAAGSAARHVEILASMWRLPGMSVTVFWRRGFAVVGRWRTAERRGVYVHDRGVQALGHVGKIDER